MVPQRCLMTVFFLFQTEVLEDLHEKFLTAEDDELTSLCLSTALKLTLNPIPISNSIDLSNSNCVDHLICGIGIGLLERTVPTVYGLVY